MAAKGPRLKRYGRVVAGHAATEARELSFKKGDTVVISTKDLTDETQRWWKGRIQGDPSKKYGVFPKEKVQLVAVQPVAAEPEIGALDLAKRLDAVKATISGASASGAGNRKGSTPTHDASAAVRSPEVIRALIVGPDDEREVLPLLALPPTARLTKVQMDLELQGYTNERTRTGGEGTSGPLPARFSWLLPTSSSCRAAS